MVFLRGKDVELYIQRLEMMIEEMANDLSKVTGFATEELIDDYMHMTAPPTVLELVLLEQGAPLLKHISLVEVWMKSKELEEMMK